MSSITAEARLPEINAYILKVHGEKRALTPKETDVIFEEGNAQLRVIRRNWPVRTGTSRAGWSFRVQGSPGMAAIVFTNPVYYSSWITRKTQTTVREGGKAWYKVLLPQVFKANRPRLVRRLKAAIDKTERQLQAATEQGVPLYAAIQQAGQRVPAYRKRGPRTAGQTFKQLIRRLG